MDQVINYRVTGRSWAGIKVTVDLSFPYPEVEDGELTAEKWAKWMVDGSSPEPMIGGARVEYMGIENVPEDDGEEDYE